MLLLKVFFELDICSKISYDELKGRSMYTYSYINNAASKILLSTVYLDS